jgi:hypothetical protein
MMKFQEGDHVLWRGLIYQVESTRIREILCNGGRRYRKPRCWTEVTITKNDPRFRHSSHADRVGMSAKSLAKHQIAVVLHDYVLPVYQPPRRYEVQSKWLFFSK